MKNFIFLNFRLRQTLFIWLQNLKRCEVFETRIWRVVKNSDPNLNVFFSSCSGIKKPILKEESKESYFSVLLLAGGICFSCCFLYRCCNDVVLTAISIDLAIGSCTLLRCSKQDFLLQFFLLLFVHYCYGYRIPPEKNRQKLCVFLRNYFSKYSQFHLQMLIDWLALILRMERAQQMLSFVFFQDCLSSGFWVFCPLFCLLD